MKMNTKGKKTKIDTDNPIVLAPMIDKLAGVVNVSDQKLFNLAFSVVLDWIQHYEPGVVRVSGGKGGLAVKIYYPVDDKPIDMGCPNLYLHLTHPKASKSQMRFEYNPTGITEAGEDHLDLMFTEMMGLGLYEFLSHARFTRVDVCRNIMFRDIEDYLIYGKWKKVSQCFFGANGKLQTITLGKSKGNQITAYDKAAQMQGSAADHSTIRVEARLRIKTGINGLASLLNPFEKVEIYSVGAKNPPYGTAHWTAFKDACRLRGVAGALKAQPVSHRAAIKKALQSYPVLWWDIAPDDWSFLWTAALEDAGLTQIPDIAPPLTVACQLGMAA